MADQSDLPMGRIAVALGTASGSAVTSAAVAPQAVASFFPTTFDGWMSIVASVLAILYTLQQFWKHEWRPWCVAKGWLK